MNEASSSVGRRALAAIMFTDTVDFSIAVRANEELALSLLRRDLELMHEVCTAHEGQVIKNTGDGLLVLFSSAVQAVAAGLKIQQSLRERSPETPADHRLMHRIGIHLGDVVVTEGDVLGDGVNLASRLEGEAEPGGICISQTTYDVVKSRLPLEAVNVGARELKNIHETIALYHIRPVGAAAPTPPVPGPFHTRHERPKSNAWVLFPAGAALAVVCVLVGTAIARVGQPDRPPASGPQPPGAAPAASAPFRQAIGSASQIANPEWERIRSAHVARGDFGGLVTWLGTPEASRVVPDPLERSTLTARYKRLEKMLGDFRREVSRHRADRPLSLFALTREGPIQLRVWTDGTRQVHIEGAGADEVTPLEKLGGVRAAQMLMGRAHQATQTGSVISRERWEDLTYLTQELGMPAPMIPGGGAPAGPPTGGFPGGGMGGPSHGMGGPPNGMGAPPGMGGPRGHRTASVAPTSPAAASRVASAPPGTRARAAAVPAVAGPPVSGVPRRTTGWFRQTARTNGPEEVVQ